MFGIDISVDWRISIHAPLTGCDNVSPSNSGPFPISIHAPLTGCDEYAIDRPTNVQNFNPRTPHGVRQGKHTLLLPE